MARIRYLTDTSVFARLTKPAVVAAFAPLAASRQVALSRPVVFESVAGGDLLAAGTHAPLCSNDAIHLAVALRVGADEIVTYDADLAERAGSAGLALLSPG
jgi:predicted nucleic acid-binding protein